MLQRNESHEVKSRKPAPTEHELICPPSGSLGDRQKSSNDARPGAKLLQSPMNYQII